VSHLCINLLTPKKINLMKTLNLVLAGFLLLALAFTSCQKDNEILPQATSELKTNDKDDGGSPWLADPIKSYPNPFLDKTTISYKVEKASRVVLVVANPADNSLTYLVQTFLRPGKYEVEFDATGLPSGMYIAHLRIGDRVFKEKMKKVTSTESNSHLAD